MKKLTQAELITLVCRVRHDLDSAATMDRQAQQLLCEVALMEQCRDDLHTHARARMEAAGFESYADLCQALATAAQKEPQREASGQKSAVSGQQAEGQR